MTTLSHATAYGEIQMFTQTCFIQMFTFIFIRTLSAMVTVNVDIFAWYIFSLISRRALDAQNLM